MSETDTPTGKADDCEELPDAGKEMPAWRYALCWLNFLFGCFAIAAASGVEPLSTAIALFLTGAASWVIGVHRLRKHHSGKGLPGFGGGF